MSLARALARAVALGLFVAAAGCGGGPEVILRTAAGAEMTAERIDADPSWLLPPGGVGWFHVDVQRTAQAEFGQYLLEDLEARVPLPPSAGLVLSRDVDRFSLATYSMKGIDFAGVASGRFDVERITAAAAEYKGGAFAPALTKSQYAGRTLFTALGVGFSLITARTAIFGNEVAIRRCLDRIQDGRVADDMPAWIKELVATPNATFSVGVDLNAATATAALPARISVLQGSSAARGIGNFDAPGINLAATISYANEAAARSSADELLRLGGSVNMYARLFGLGQPIQKLETQASGTDTRVVLGVDKAAIQTLMQRFLPPPAAPSNQGPGWATRSSVLRDPPTAARSDP